MTNVCLLGSLLKLLMLSIGFGYQNIVRIYTCRQYGDCYSLPLRGHHVLYLDHRDTLSVLVLFFFS